MLRTGADVDRNQDYPRFVLSVITSSDFAVASSFIPIFRVLSARLDVTRACINVDRYNVELVISRYRLIISPGAKFSAAGAPMRRCPRYL